MIEFYLPQIHDSGLFDFNKFFFDLYKNNKDYFNDDVFINSVYGCFNNSPWTGGRKNNLSFVLDVEQCKKKLDYIESLGIKIRFVFSNSLINKKMLDDKVSNELVSYANKNGNYIILLSDLLYDYLKERYKNYKYVLSMTALITDINKYNELTKKYDMVVLDWRLNKSIEKLKTIEDKDKIEIIANMLCTTNCDNVVAHYTSVDIINATGLKIKQKKICKMSDKIRVSNSSYFDYIISTYKNKSSVNSVITLDEIYKYRDMGFKTFKLIGRDETHIGPMFISYMYYLIKKEKWNNVFDMLRKTKYSQQVEEVIPYIEELR